MVQKNSLNRTKNIAKVQFLIPISFKNAKFFDLMQGLVRLAVTMRFYVGVQGSGLAPRAWFPLITCEKGSAGSTGLEGSTVVVRRLKIWKRRGGLKLAVFSYRKPNP